MTAESQPRVTTVVPTYRRPELLRRALESVSLQTYPSFQVHVYDNASGDSTAEVVRAFAERDPRFRYHAHPGNIGSERNFKFGMGQVETEYFSLLSDDDLLLPRFYELSVAALDRHAEAAMASTGVIHANGAGALAREPSLEPGLHQPPEGLVAMLRANQPAWTGTLFRRSLVEKAGAIDEQTVIDLDLELRIAAHHPVLVLAEPGAVLNTANHFGKCLGWWDSYQRTIAKIEGDQSLPAEVRGLARISLERRLETTVFQTGLVASRLGRFDLARQAAHVLSSRYGDRRRAAIVTAMAVAGRAAPLLGPPYRRLRGIAGRSARGGGSESEVLRDQLWAMAPYVAGLLTPT